MDVRLPEQGASSAEPPEDPRKRFTLSLLVEIDDQGEPVLESAEIQYRDKTVLGAGQLAVNEITEAVVDRYNETRPLTRADRQRFRIHEKPKKVEDT